MPLPALFRPHSNRFFPWFRRVPVGGALLGASVALCIGGFSRTAVGPELYGAGLFSTGAWDFFMAIAPDRPEVFFCRANPQFSEYRILMTRRGSDGGWQAVTDAPFAAGWGNADPHFTPRGDSVFFASNRPGPGETGAQKTYDIWVAGRGEGDRWGTPRRLESPVSSDTSDEWSPSVGANGDLYFGSERAGGRGRMDLWVARSVGGKYAPPENLGEAINTTADEVEPWIAPDGSYLIFSARGRTDSVGGYDLYLSRRVGGRWSKARRIDRGVSTPATELNHSVSPDGEWLYFSSTRKHQGQLGERFDRPQRDSAVAGIGNGQGDIYRIPIRELDLRS